MKSAQIWSYFWSVFSYIQTEYGDVLNTENTEFYISKAVWFVKEHIQKFGKSRDVQYVK